MSAPLPPDDLAHVEDLMGESWTDLRGARVFLTGGTGFFGQWLVGTLLHANRRHRLNVDVTILTRDPARARATLPAAAADSAVRFHAGDVRDFPFPEGAFTHVIHAATDARASLLAENPRRMFDTIVEGTRRTLEFADARGVGVFLLTSSGAVYGPQPANLSAIPETYGGGPDPLTPAAAYAEGKRVAEHLCALAGSATLRLPIARCFAFVGPHLPLDAHFAVGNFLRDGLAGGPITVRGDGTPVRSYLHAADLAVWLWTLLLRGPSLRAINVGSDEGLSIAALAERVADAFTPRPEVRIPNPPAFDPRQPAPTDFPVARYVPDISRARDELGLDVRIRLDAALARTRDWLLTAR